MCATKKKKKTNNNEVTQVCICHNKGDSSGQNPDLVSAVLRMWSTAEAAAHVFWLWQREEQHCLFTVFSRAPYRGSFAPSASGGDGGSSGTKGLLRKKTSSCHNLPAPQLQSPWYISWSNWSFGGFERQRWWQTETLCACTQSQQGLADVLRCLRWQDVLWGSSESVAAQLHSGAKWTAPPGGRILTIILMALVILWPFVSTNVWSFITKHAQTWDDFGNSLTFHHVSPSDQSHHHHCEHFSMKGLLSWMEILASESP